MSQTITAQVEDFYSNCATSGTQPGRATYNNRIATAFGYTAEELQAIPDTANLGLSSGNPLATANLKEVQRRFILISSISANRNLSGRDSC